MGLGQVKPSNIRVGRDAPPWLIGDCSERGYGSTIGSTIDAIGRIQLTDRHKAGTIVEEMREGTPVVPNVCLDASVLVNENQ